MSISMNMTGTWRRRLARVSAPLRALAPPPLPSTPLSCPRPVIRGKFLLAGEQKLYVRGVTYGAFRPDAEGNEYHDLDTIEQAWFRDVRFRQAVSAAIDRAGIVRLAHHGRAVPLASHVSPGNRPRINAALKPPARSLGRARELLAAARFSWKADGTLVVGVKDGLANFRPAVLDHYTLWNADELFWRSRAAARRP